MAFWWDIQNKRYRGDNGRFVSGKTVYDFSQKSIAATIDKVKGFADSIGKSEMTPAQWYKAMKSEIKGEYIRQYMLAHGGRDSMMQSDWGKIGNMVKGQYKYLDGFLQEIAAGNLSPEQIAMRAAMYINSAEQGFERAREDNAEAWGATEERWATRPGAEHCVDCLAYEGEGWKPLGYFPTPGAGSTQCLTNCQCTKEYRNGSKTFKG